MHMFALKSFAYVTHLICPKLPDIFCFFQLFYAIKTRISPNPFLATYLTLWISGLLYQTPCFRSWFPRDCPICVKHACVYLSNIFFVVLLFALLSWTISLLVGSTIHCSLHLHIWWSCFLLQLFTCFSSSSRQFQSSSNSHPVILFPLAIFRLNSMWNILFPLLGFFDTCTMMLLVVIVRIPVLCGSSKQNRYRQTSFLFKLREQVWNIDRKSYNISHHHHDRRMYHFHWNIAD